MRSQLQKIWWLLNERKDYPEHLFKEVIRCTLDGNLEGLDKVIAELEQPQQGKVGTTEPNFPQFKVQAGMDFGKFMDTYVKGKEPIKFVAEYAATQVKHGAADWLVAAAKRMHKELSRSVHGVDPVKVLANVMLAIVNDDESKMEIAENMVMERGFDYLHPCNECKKEFQQEMESLMDEYARCKRDRDQLIRKEQERTRQVEQKVRAVVRSIIKQNERN